jgi:hypothetical protein
MSKKQVIHQGPALSAQPYVNALKMSNITDPVIMEILVDRLGSDARLVVGLSRTCTRYRNVFPYTEHMENLTRRLMGLTEMVLQGIKMKLEVKAESFLCKKLRAWQVTALWAGSSDHGSGKSTGTILIGKCAASLSIVGENTWNGFKDSFWGIQDLQDLKQCLASHITLCHELPENLQPLPSNIRHRHRDTVSWDSARAFYTWRATRPGYATWNDRGRDPRAVGPGTMTIHRGGNLSSTQRVRMI